MEIVSDQRDETRGATRRDETRLAGEKKGRWTSLGLFYRNTSIPSAPSFDFFPPKIRGISLPFTLKVSQLDSSLASIFTISAVIGRKRSRKFDNDIHILRESEGGGGGEFRNTTFSGWFEISKQRRSWDISTNLLSLYRHKKNRRINIYNACNT